MSGEKVHVVELFAGVGGFRAGLESASGKFETIWANQWEPGKKKQHAFDCYVHHFKESKNHINMDINDVKDDVPKHDLLVGGFPCQDYSVARTKAEGITGKKGVLWWNIDYIISKKKPDYILLENVDRLIRSPSSQRGRDFAIILRSLYDKGYLVEWRVINAAEYGEAQKRRRTFIFACRRRTNLYKKLKWEIPENIVKNAGLFASAFPIHGPEADKVSTFSIKRSVYPTLVEVSDNFSKTFYNCGVMVNGNVYTRNCKPNYSGEQKTLGSTLSKNVDEKYFKTDVEKWRFMKGAKSIARVDDNGWEYYYTEGSIPFPDDLTKPGRTILTSEGSVNRSSHLVEPEEGRYRILTPEECERMNGFDTGWTDTGMPESMRYFTMGNALVVPIITKMGNAFLRLIDDSETDV
jgi:DNA-methyltransferase (dcm)